MSEQTGRSDSGSTAAESSASLHSRPLRHVPALDGLRAVAVLLVMCYHASLPSGGKAAFEGGRAGVDIFFVLSGFLITALLLDEQAKTGTIRLRAFYMRRILRLYPALVVAIGVALGLCLLKMPVFGAGTKSLRATLEGMPFSLLYTINIARAAHWSGGGFLAHTWSLAIEEQFYLVWPIVVILVMRRHCRPGVLGGIAAVCAVTSFALRAGLVSAGVDAEVLFNATYSHVDGIFAGCALGVAWSMRSRIVNWIAHPIITAGAIVTAVAVIGLGNDMVRYGLFVVVVATVMVVAALLMRPQSVMNKVLSRRSMVEIGKRSYGIYLFHWPIFQFIGIDTRPLVLVFGFGSTLAVAWVSFWLVETPFLRMKRRWTYRAHPPTDFPEARSTPTSV